MAEPTPQLQTLSRALDVLELIESSPVPVSLSELARTMDESTPIVFRILQTLEARGYIRRRPEDKRYSHTGRSTGSGAVRRAIMLLRSAAAFSFSGSTLEELAERASMEVAAVEELLGSLQEERFLEIAEQGRLRLGHGLIELVRPFLNGDDLAVLVRPLMERLHGRTDETVSLFRRSGNRQFVVTAMPSSKPIRYMLETGSSFPLHLGAAGKAELAMMSVADQYSCLETIMAEQSAEMRGDLTRILEDLAETRRRGFALSAGERIEGACSVAAPLRDSAGEVRAVVGLMMPAFRVTSSELMAMGEMLLAETRQLQLPANRP